MDGPWTLGLIGRPGWTTVRRVAETGIYQDWSELVSAAASVGKLELIKWVYDIVKENGKDFPVDRPLFYACCEGHLEVVKWFYSTFNPDWHRDNCRMFKVARGSGKLEVVEWLYNLCSVGVDNLASGLIDACVRGRIEVIRWILSLGLVDIAVVFNEWQLTLVSSGVESWPMFGVVYRAAGVRVDFDRLFRHLKGSHPNREDLMFWRGYVDPGDDCYSMEVRGRLVVMSGLGLPNELEREVLEWCGWR